MKYYLEVKREKNLYPEENNKELHVIEGNFYYLCKMICEICTRHDKYKVYPGDIEAEEEWEAMKK